MGGNRALETRWARVRGLLIAFALGVEAVRAIPSKPLQDQHFTLPQGVRTLDQLEAGLSLVGARPGRAAIQQTLVASSAAILEVRESVLAPFEAVFHATATGQQWTLFLSAHRECFRLHIDGRAHEHEPWQSLYRALSHDALGLAPLLEYRRARGLYDPGRISGPSPAYAGLTQALALRVFAARPSLTRVRVRLERLRVGAAGEALASLGMEHERQYERPRP